MTRTYSDADRLARLASRWPGVPGRLPSLIALTDPERTKDAVGFAETLPQGCGLIYRHFGQADRAATAQALARVADDRQITLLVAADPELASACDADGVHWPARMASAARAWARQRGDLVMTVSAHNRAELARAGQLGADAALLSPVFSTRSHSQGNRLGPLRSMPLVTQAELPVYALGGITAQSARRLSHCGFSGMAAIDGLKR